MVQKCIKNGLVITLEGTDACGKTTQAKLLCQALEEMGFKTEHVKEPGGTVLADKLRELLIWNTTHGCHPGVEVTLFLAAKIDLYQRVVLPALEAGRIVVSERGWISMFAYQAGGRQLRLSSLESLKVLSRVNFGMDIGPYNGLQLLLDQDLSQSRERVRLRAAHGLVADRFESESDRFFNDIDSLYRTYFKAREQNGVVVLEQEKIHEHYRIVDINGTDVEQTHTLLRKTVTDLLSTLDVHDYVSKSTGELECQVLP